MAVLHIKRARPLLGPVRSLPALRPEKLPYAINRYRREAERHYGVLDKHLDGREFIVGQEYSIVDMSAWGWVDRAKFVFFGSEDPLAPLTNVARWFKAINARPAVARARAVGSDHAFKKENDEETRRALFPRTTQWKRRRRARAAQIAGKCVLITGGSSGIGLATAQALGARGARLLLTARRLGPLETEVAPLRTSGVDAHLVAADVTTDLGRTAMLNAARQVFGRLNLLVNNAGGVRAGRLRNTKEAEIRAMIDVDLLAPILLTRVALPELRSSGQGLIVNVTGGSAFFGMPFYTTYSATKAGLARLGEAMRRELNGEGVHVMTVYPAATDTPMLATNNAGPDLGFDIEPASAIVDAIVAGIEADALEVVRGGAARTAMAKLNQEDPGAIDQRFLAIKARLEDAVRNHTAR